MVRPNLIIRALAGNWNRLLPVWIFLSLAPYSAWSGPAAAPAEVTTFHQFYTLTPDAASQGRQVRIKGVVLCYDPGWNQLYLHDGTETRWFDPWLFQTNLAAGQQVEVTGITEVGHDGLDLTNLHLQILGAGVIPKPKPLLIRELGGDFGQWVETKGLIRVADTSSGRLSLVIQDQGQTCLVYVLGLPATNNFNWLVGGNVRIRGINASKISGGQLTAPSLFAPDANAIILVELSHTKPNDLPVSSVVSLLDRELGLWTNQPLHLKGAIVAYQPGESVVVKDSTGTIRANVIQTTEAQIGAHIDLWGYLTVLPGQTILGDAYFEINPSSAVTVTVPQAGQASPKPVPTSGELVDFAAVSKLTPEEAANGLPVRLRGTVTYADWEWRNCFIQGQDGAIYFVLNQPEIKVGQWVEVVGQTSPGGYAPQLANTSIRVLGTTNLPPPVIAELEDFAGGNLDSRWVQIDGVVRRTSSQWGHSTLVLTTPKGRFKVIVPVPADRILTANLINAVVRVRGVCTSEMNARSQLTGIIIYAPDLNQITTVVPALTDPFAVPETEIGSVARFDPNRLAVRRVKVGGMVTLILPDKGFYVQNASAGIFVNTTQTKNLHAGDSVRVVGYPALGDFSPQLEDVQIQGGGTTPVPQPEPASAEEILMNGTHDSTLVQLEGTLVQSLAHSAQPKLVLQSGSVIFTAILLTEASGRRGAYLQAGSLLHLTGVCQIQAGESHEPESIQLLVAGTQDVKVLREPPWWTIRHTVILASTLGLGMLLALVWSRSLRRQVQAQIKIIRQNEQALMTVSRRAGMAEVATAVLHDVGNVLNSVNVSATLAADELRESKTGDVSLVAALMKERAADLGHFITQDAKGRRLPDYLATLGGQLVAEKQFVLGELERLASYIQHIKDIIATQQNHAKLGSGAETVDVAGLIEDALRMNATALARNQIKVVRDYDPMKPCEIMVEKNKVLQIFVNLVKNANHACAESARPEKCLSISLSLGDSQVSTSFTDNGVGIPRDNLSRIFTYGFTTRKNGHGFGLHSAAISAQELGGVLLATSPGPDRGATFTLLLPTLSKPQ